MPLHKCSKNNKSGWKYGQSGHCYTGTSGLAKAKRQMRAMFASGYKGRSK